MIAAPPSRDLTQPDKFSSKEFREGLKLSNFKRDEFLVLQLLFEIFYLIFMRGSAPCFKSLAPVCRRLKFPTIFFSLWCQDAKKMSYAKLQNLKTHQTILLCIYLFEFYLRIEVANKTDNLFWARLFTSSHTLSVDLHIPDGKTGWLDTSWLTFTELSSSNVSDLGPLFFNLILLNTRVLNGQVFLRDCVQVLGEPDFLLVLLLTRNSHVHIEHVGVHLRHRSDAQLLTVLSQSLSIRNGKGHRAKSGKWSLDLTKRAHILRAEHFRASLLYFDVLFRDSRISTQLNRPFLTSILMFPPRFCVGNLIRWTLGEEQRNVPSSLDHTHKATEVDRT